VHGNPLLHTILENDHTPVFNEIQYSFSVPEGSTLLPASFNVSASDIDLGRMVVYAISLVGMRKAHLCWVSVMQHVHFHFKP
jgi:hypothetical protein